ncbi:UDP-3-O-acyl-N-acetylglucosamine deacetylase [Paracoccus sp. SCSIO 75233]|uniref:UDP-3-O-acyl-N-acetylglucosamine deacetylase n=1 Tax=Paracoccus sp. SCSIO 75233 TaxID=3017782 RepID=UPI0022F0603C|nr:UDP-3-O-acyl-N-acetylglucosamine deacetylase [Paracoccus sp. SCSIO 75233]WBU52567.1 UDP-3-O-acyl-N-acetylglucosamine deacetylase [Paracoccus sp. SCSIO 75233]
MQATIAKATEFRGVGLHSGVAVRMDICPAPTGHGIVFERTDLPAGENRIPALWDRVVPSKLCTLIENDHGARVSTIEHIMAALAGTGIQNALIRIDAPEVPILDGSSAIFVSGILQAGIRVQDAELRAIRLKRPVEVREGEAVARLEPADHLEIDFHIDFTDAAIGRQEKALDMANGAFVRELMDSRTFCRQSDVDVMRQNGLALGGTYMNAVVVDGDKVLSPGGLRHKDEAVRHKMLDAMGDLALAGAPLLARYSGNRAGHAMTNKLLRALFAAPDAWEWEVCASDLECRLPGAGVAAYGPVNAPALIAVA